MVFKNLSRRVYPFRLKCCNLAQLNLMLMKKIIVINSLFILSLFIPSCKDEVEGCRDVDAKNYNPEADADCNCCKYEGSVVFWTSASTSSTYVSSGITNVKYYVDGDYIGSVSANLYFNNPPGCGNPDAVTVAFDLGSKKSGQASLELRDQDDDVIVTETITFTANTCTSYEI